MINISRAVGDARPYNQTETYAASVGDGVLDVPRTRTNGIKSYVSPHNLIKISQGGLEPSPTPSKAYGDLTGRSGTPAPTLKLDTLLINDFKTTYTKVKSTSGSQARWFICIYIIRFTRVRTI